MKKFWNERYQQSEFIYGETPNEFFKQFIDQSAIKGKILLTAEGEGRNATYAALKSWEVIAFDYSESAKNKAEQLAQKYQVHFDYNVQSVENILDHYSPATFDAIGVIYNHYPVAMRAAFLDALPILLKKGGKIILEVFNKQQLGNPSGGPKNVDMLYDIELLKHHFEAHFDFEILENVQITLHEGRFHEGKADVIRMIAVKR